MPPASMPCVTSSAVVAEPYPLRPLIPVTSENKPIFGELVMEGGWKKGEASIYRVFVSLRAELWLAHTVIVMFWENQVVQKIKLAKSVWWKLGSFCILLNK